MQKTPLTLAVVLTVALSLTATGISVYQFRYLHAGQGLYRSLPPQEETVIDRTTVDALRHIVQARADIHGNEPERARYDVAEAARIAGTIRDDLSSATVRNRIGIARKHLEFEPAEQVLRDLPAIYAALDETEDYLPTDRARQRLDAARAYLEKNDKGGAGRELALADKSLVTVEVELPLLDAEKYIDEARRDLAGGNVAKADAALKLAEQKTQAISIIVKSPLHRAKRSFWLAVKRYSAGNTADARMYVEQAKTYLEQASKLGDAKGREEAGQLLKDVAELERKIDAGGKAGGTALLSAWERSKALAEREADYLAAGWSEEETIQPREYLLIEAKLHVACAESYQVTAGEPARAVKELDRAETYLEKASKSGLTGVAVQQKIVTTEKKLAQLKLRPADSGAAIRESYDAIIEDLGEMIHHVKSSDMVQEMEESG